MSRPAPRPSPRTLGIVATLTLGALGVFGASVGCSLIVTGDLPTVACTGTDPSSCPSGSICDATIGRCVATASTDAAALDDAQAEDGSAADDAGDEDVDSEAPPSRTLGAQCRIDDDCDSAICGTNTLLTQAVVEGTGPICTKTCCTSSDCDDGFVCFGAGTGGNFCVPAAKANRHPPDTGGGRGPGVACAKDDECRAGACVDGRCRDTCCLPSNCLGDSVCQVSTVSGPGPAHDAWVCAGKNANATKAAGDACNHVEGECANNNCTGAPAKCLPSCCRRTDCSDQGFPGTCRYVESGSDELKVCVGSSGSTKDGQTCVNNSDCMSGYCDPELGVCAQVCCQDADCKANQVCRPSGTKTPFLRCVAGRR